MTARAPKKHYPAARPKVPPFARYEGTSAWRKYRNRVREYYTFLAKAKQTDQGAHPAS